MSIFNLAENTLCQSKATGDYAIVKFFNDDPEKAYYALVDAKNYTEDQIENAEIVNDMDVDYGNTN